MVTESGVYTNVGRARAFRAPGFPTGAWALEQMVDMLAEKIGMDPVEFRLKNFTDISQSRKMPYSSAGLKDCLIEGAKKFGWKEARAGKKDSGPVKRGIGVAAGLWMMGSGGPPTRRKSGCSPMAASRSKPAPWILARAPKLWLAWWRRRNWRASRKRPDSQRDTAITPYASSSGGSMTLASLVPAVRRGAWIVKRQILDWAAEALGVPADDLEIRKESVVSRSTPEKKRTLEQIFRAKGVMDVIAIGNREPNPPIRS